MEELRREIARHEATMSRFDEMMAVAAQQGWTDTLLFHRNWSFRIIASLKELLATA